MFQICLNSILAIGSSQNIFNESLKIKLINFNLLKEHSSEVTVTGMVRYNLYAITNFGQIESSSNYFNAFIIFEKVASCTSACIIFA